MDVSITMKELPVSEQPYEKCEAYGASALSDVELLAVILRSGTANLKSTDVAIKLLTKRTCEKGLCGLMYMSQKELMTIPGIGRVKAILLQCVVELCSRMAKVSRMEGLSLTSPKTVADVYMQEMRFLTKEQTRVLFFDTKSKLLGEKVVSIGCVNASIMSPRDIFLAALEEDAVHIILMHNHPSGDPTPSKEDIMVTKRMKEAGNLIGISLLDHIIIGDNRYVSLKEQGLI
jgi:DNA repair protein RadC